MINSFIAFVFFLMYSFFSIWDLTVSLQYEGYLESVSVL